jgi:antitoxin component YwqK of YwqJK toxin-antitoxin module
MKYFLYAIIFLFCLSSVQGQSFKIVDGDTINKIDANRKRQGNWIVSARASVNFGYENGELLEKGQYINGRKEGVWKKYFPGGKVKSEIFYKGSRPKGAYTLYYENGNIEESGNWARTKNIGEFKRYHPNGKVAQAFSFTESGQRTGKQTYFYSNGNVRLEGTWTGGVESGEMKEYYESGDIMSVKNFKDGVLDKASVESYAAKTEVKDAVQEIIDQGKDINVTVTKTETPNQGTFNGDGYKQIFNTDKQIAKDGTFKRYRLIDGKQYIYDDNGLLKQIMIFKEGRYIGDGVIED